jgi:Tol biopolymer transport system component
MTPPRILLAAAAVLLGACSKAPPPAWVVRPDRPDEPHLRNVRQITFGGENAEGYWSSDGKRIVFQMRGRRGVPADQIHVMEADGRDERLVSTGKGRTTCAYFLPGDEEVVYASTHHAGDEVPKPPPAVPGGYTWALYDFDLYVARLDGTEVRRLTETPGYDAEATVGPDGTILFTSARDGDLELYTMRPDGTGVRRLTTTPGYDGGAFFSRDGTKIVYRANHPEDEPGLADFRRLLAANRVQPTRMDIWVMDADGTGQRQVTSLPGASFAPYFHPDGKRIVFASNHQDPRSRNFDLWIVGIDGQGLERVTAAPEFDSFPMFSPDGRTLIFASNRHAEKEGDTNLFLADWAE